MVSVQHSWGKIFFGLIATVFVTLVPSHHNSFGDEFGRVGNLELWIKADKRKYDMGEPVFITFILKNRTKETLTVNKRWGFLREFTLEAFKEPGGPQSYRPAQKEIPYKRQDFMNFKPEEDLELIMKLNEYLANPLKPGLYSLRASYKNQESGKIFQINAWTGEIVSNRINITVKSSTRISFGGR